MLFGICAEFRNAFLLGSSFICFAFQGQDFRQQFVRVSVFWIELNGAANLALRVRQFAGILERNGVQVKRWGILLRARDSSCE